MVPVQRRYASFLNPNAVEKSKLVVFLHVEMWFLI